MTSQERTIEGVLERLARLERQNDRLKRIGAAVLVGAAALLLMAQKSQTKVVEANEFVLRDNSGRVRASLSVDSLLGDALSSAQLVLFDIKGRRRVVLASGSVLPDSGTALLLADSQGRTRLRISAEDSLGGTLDMLNEKQAPVTTLTTSSAKLPMVTADSVITPNLLLARDINNVGGILTVGADNTGGIALLSGGYRDMLDLQPSFARFSKLNGSIPGPANIVTLVQQATVKAAFLPDSLFVSDDQGFSADLGVQDLVTPRTGETQKTSAASLILFDKNKSVIWKTP